MKKVVLIIVLLSSVAAAEPTAFVVNSMAETMSRIDLVNGGIQNHITLLGDVPNDIAYKNDRLYVINSVSASVQVIDAISYGTIATIPLPIGSNPYSITVADDYAYVSGWVSGEIYRIDLGDNRIDTAITIGGYPEGMLLYDGMLFVTQTAFNPGDFSYGQGQLAQIETNSFQLAGEENIGCNPQSIMLESGGLLHVVCTGNYSDIEGSVYIFNPYTDELDDSLLTGGQPVSGVIASNGVAFLAAGGWVDHGIVLSYDVHSKQVLHGMSNPIIVGLGATDIALDSLGFIYTSNFGNDSVTKLNQTGETVATYQMGDGPQALVIMDDRLSEMGDDGESPNLPELAGISGNYPNPFNSNTIIAFGLPVGAVGGGVEIFDIQGRLIREISVGTVSGKGEVLWDGLNDSGFECASGVYMARLSVESAGNRKFDGNTLKLSLVR